MLLGKRSRHPIKRTTSMTGITVDVSNVDDDVQQPSKIMSDPHPHMHNPLHEFPNANFAVYDPRFLAMVSPRNTLSLSAVAAAPGRTGSTSTNNHVVDSTAPFLRSCCLCNRRLAPGRDIYMYRGDTAFCSLECREQQMKQDERKERLNNVVEDRHGHASSTSSNSKPSTKTESAAAA